jgi:hypothetical protein
VSASRHIIKRALERFSLDLSDGDEVLYAIRHLDVLADAICSVYWPGTSTTAIELEDILDRVAKRDPTVRPAVKSARKFRKIARKVSYGMISDKDLTKANALQEEFAMRMWTWLEGGSDAAG